MKRGKKYQDAVKAFDKKEQYDVADAISIVKKNATAKFDETIELHLRTGCDGRHAEQQIRGAVVLPHGTGKTVKVLVFAKGTKLDEAQAAGADYVGGEELIPKIQNEGWLDFDVVVAYPFQETAPSHEVKIPQPTAAGCSIHSLENHKSAVSVQQQLSYCFFHFR